VKFGNIEMTDFYLGSNRLRYIYQGDDLIWPTTPAAWTPPYRNYFKGYNNLWAVLIEDIFGETITGMIEISGSGGIPNWNSTSSWESSTPYTYGGGCFENARATEYYDEQVTQTFGSTWIHFATYEPSTRVWNFPNLTRMDDFEFRGHGLVGIPLEIRVPSLSFVTFNTFKLMNDNAVNGSLTISSAVNGNGNWPSNRDYLLGRGWTINYVNN
jgi:hypothetical protein